MMSLYDYVGIENGSKCSQHMHGFGTSKINNALVGIIEFMVHIVEYTPTGGSFRISYDYTISKKKAEAYFYTFTVMNTNNYQYRIWKKNGFFFIINKNIQAFVI